MANRPKPYDKADPERRTPVTNDLAPEGMDSESESDELEAGVDDEAEQFDNDDSDDHVEPDGVRESPSEH